MAYSDKVIDHYENPRNVGSFDKGDENVGTGVQQYAATHDVLGLPDLMQGSGQQDPMMQGAAKAIEAVATGGKDGKSAAPWAALTAIISNSKI